MKFGFGPGSRGAGADVPQRASGEREFGDVVAAWRFDNEEQIVFTGGEIDLFDLDSQFLRHLLGGLAALGSFLDPTDSLIAPRLQRRCRFRGRSRP